MLLKIIGIRRYARKCKLEKYSIFETKSKELNSLMKLKKHSGNGAGFSLIEREGFCVGGVIKLNTSK